MATNNVHIRKGKKRMDSPAGKRIHTKKRVSTQKQAIKLRREIARNNKLELIIQGRYGRIKEKNSYGNDPRRIKG